MNSRKGLKAGGLRKLIAYLVLIILAFLCLFFFYILIINSTRNHAQIQKGFSAIPGSSFMKNFNNVLNDANVPILSGIKNSFIVSAASAALAVYFSALTAYGIYAYDFKLKKPAFVFILLILVMPTQVSALGFLRLVKKIPFMSDNLLPLIIPSIAAPAIFYFMYSYMQSSLPMELVEAARIDGCSEFKTFNRVVMPIMKPALAVQAIFAFVSSWNNYFMPALVINRKELKTLPILIASLSGADFLKFDMGKVYSLIMIAIIPIIIVYIILSKYIVAGVTLGGVKE